MDLIKANQDTSPKFSERKGSPLATTSVNMQ